jgi:hypothetical protein
MDRASARHHDRRRPGAVAHQHGRGPRRRSGRFNRLDEVAIAYAFALWAVGLADKGEV